MSLLRIYASLADAPPRCQWSLVSDNNEMLAGEAPLAQLPRRAAHVHLVIPASQVLITRARMPQSARRHTGSVLAYAVEDATVGEPDNAQVSWLGKVIDTAGTADVLAVLDKAGLKRWLDALDNAGIHTAEVHCETLLIPWTEGEWSLVWDGQEGIVRTGQFEGAATDCGDRRSPPLSLRLMLADALSRNERPASIALYGAAQDMSKPGWSPDIGAWQSELGVAIRLAGPWDWKTAPQQAGIKLAQRRRWSIAPDAIARLRPVARIMFIALAIHAAALITDWTLLARQQNLLRQNMTTRFLAAFPDTVAVVDPALQMRRKLAEARHAAGLSDNTDFLPMITLVAAAAKELPAGTLRTVSYEAGRMTIELSAADPAGIRRVVAQLVQAGLLVVNSQAPSATVRPASETVILTVLAS